MKNNTYWNPPAEINTFKRPTCYLDDHRESTIQTVNRPGNEESSDFLQAFGVSIQKSKNADNFDGLKWYYILSRVYTIKNHLPHETAGLCVAVSSPEEFW